MVSAKLSKLRCRDGVCKVIKVEMPWRCLQSYQSWDAVTVSAKLSKLRCRDGVCKVIKVEMPWWCLQSYKSWDAGSNPKGSRWTLFAPFCRILLNYINWRSESYQHQLGEKNTWPLSHQDWPPSSYSWANAVSTTSTGQGAPEIRITVSEWKISKLSRRLRTVGCFGMV